MILLTLKPCHSEKCSEQHSETDSFFSENIGDNEKNDDTEESFFSVTYCIEFNKNFCKKKLNFLSLRLQSETAVSLWIQYLGELLTYSSHALSLIKLPSIRCLNLIINEDFQFSSETANDLFDHIQNAPKLKILEMNFKQSSLFDMSYEFLLNPVSLVFHSKEGSLVNLESLRIFSDIPCLNENSFEILERAMISSGRESGSLSDFSLNTIENTLSEVSFRSISRILKYNKDSLKNIKIKQVEAHFPKNPAINVLGDAFQFMTNIKFLSLNLRVQGDDLENPFLYLDLKELLNGIALANSQLQKNIKDSVLTLDFNRIFLLNSSKLRSCFCQFSDVNLNGLLFSVSTATQLGLALGKSKNLMNLKIASKRPELGVLLMQTLAHSKSLTRLSVSYLGKTKGFFRMLEEALKQNNQSLKDLYVVLTEQNLSLKYVSHVFNGVVEMKSLEQFSLTGISITKENNKYFPQLFETISKSKSLKILKVLMQSIPLFEEGGTLIPENIYQPLNNSLKTLETLYLNQKSQSEDQKQENIIKIHYIKLFKGLLDHPNAYQFSLGSKFEEIQIIEEEYKNTVESNINSIIAFTKAISSNLSFHPNLHIIDLYFS